MLIRINVLSNVHLSTSAAHPYLLYICNIGKMLLKHNFIAFHICAVVARGAAADIYMIGIICSVQSENLFLLSICNLHRFCVKAIFVYLLVLVLLWLCLFAYLSLVYMCVGTFERLFGVYIKAYVCECAT